MKKDCIEENKQEMEIRYSKLTGQTKVQDRMDLVNEFNNNEDIKKMKDYLPFLLYKLIRHNHLDCYSAISRNLHTYL